MASAQPTANDPTTPRISVVFPCLNESGNLLRLVERVRRAEEELGFSIEIVFVDDGSTDGTGPEMASIANRERGVVAASHPVNRGIAAAWTTGIRSARSPWAVLCDADLQYDPADLSKLWHAVRESGEGVVQGRRVFDPDSCSKLRLVLSLSFSRLLNLCFGVSLRDVKSDFLMAPRAWFSEVLADAAHFRFFQHYIAIGFLKRGVSIHQVPVRFGRRHAGRSFIGHPLRFSAAALWELPRARAFYRGVARDAEPLAPQRAE